MMMKNLLENDFVTSLNVKSHPIADCLNVSSTEFDLDDMDSPINELAFGEGKVSFRNNTFGNIQVIAYENFIDQCVNPKSFLVGRKKCDYLMIHANSSGYVLLLEVSSALGDSSNLSQPILSKGKNKRVVYSGGKFQKCEEQLCSSLSDLMSVPSIKNILSSKERKVCLMGYRINPHTDRDYLLKHPFERYLHVEMKATAEKGALLPSPEINALGFEYRRISHVFAFDLN